MTKTSHCKIYWHELLQIERAQKRTLPKMIPECTPCTCTPSMWHLSWGWWSIGSSSHSLHLDRQTHWSKTT